MVSVFCCLNFTLGIIVPRLLYPADNMPEDALFAAVRRMQGDLPWGSVLDAGTGDHSLNWIIDLPTTKWTAITGDQVRNDGMIETFSSKMRDNDILMKGNWLDHTMLVGEEFDVVLADYLIGAMDGFSPYFQDEIFNRLKPHVGKRLYIIGLEPLPDKASTRGGQLMVEVARLRDACILLAGHRCYREFPRTWVERQLKKSGFKVIESVSLPNVYSFDTVDRQLKVAERKLPFFREEDAAMRDQMQAHIDRLRARVAAAVEEDGPVRVGYDYVVAAEIDVDGGDTMTGGDDTAHGGQEGAACLAAAVAPASVRIAGGLPEEEATK